MQEAGCLVDREFLRAVSLRGRSSSIRLKCTTYGDVSHQIDSMYMVWIDRRERAVYSNKQLLLLVRYDY